MYPHPLLSLVLIFSVRLLIGWMMLPPWQQPDEPSHMATVRILARGGNLAFPRTPEPEVEGVIIESMARHDWWSYYERSTPDPLPTSLEQTQSSESAVVTGSRVYYRAAAVVINVAGIETVDDQLRLLRALSAFLAIVTLCVVYLGARIVVGAYEAVAPAALIGLHPQFLLNSLAVTPDAAVNLCGAVVWWQAMHVVAARGPARAGVTMSVFAFTGALLRRVGVPLLIAAVIPFVARVWVGYYAHRSARVSRVFAGIGGVGLIAAIALFVSGQVTRMAQEARVVLDEMIRHPPALTLLSELRLAVAYALVDLARALESPLDWRFFGHFSQVLFDSAWLVGGWMRYPAPDWWLLIMHGFGVLGLVGLCRPRARVGLPPLVLGTSLAMFATQVLAIYVLYFPRHLGPQGRYMFPMIGAAGTLLWIGWRGWVSAERRPSLLVAWIAFLVVMEIGAWVLVLLRLYA